MKVIEATKSQLVLKSTRKDGTYGEHGAFIFDIGIVSDKPRPQRIIIKEQSGHNVISWSTSWKKFLDEICIGDVVILRKDKLLRSTE